MSIDSTLFRQVMRRFATGVTILTARLGEQNHGMTANSFTSVSLTPTLVLVCVTKNKTMHEFVTRSGAFAINILSEQQENLARRFAHQMAYTGEPFADLAHHREATGAPIIDNSIAYLDCRVVAAHDAGDHTIFIGEVQRAGFGTARDDRPLIWLDGKYAVPNNTDTLALAHI